MTWWSGDTLLSALDAIRPAPRLVVGLPLRVPIAQVWDIAKVGTVLVSGRVETGVIQSGMRITTTTKPSSSSAEGTVGSIEINHEQVQEALSGMDITFVVKGIPRNDLHRGCVIGTYNDPARGVESFTAEITVIASILPQIRVGYCPIVACHTDRAECEITEIVSRIQRRSKQLEMYPTHLTEGDRAVIRLTPRQQKKKAFVCMPFQTVASMGRIWLLHINAVFALGVIIHTIEKISESK